MIKRGGSRGALGPADYRALAEFRYAIRRFLNFSEDAARHASIQPRQHQLLLAVKGLPPTARPTLRTVSERLQLRHHSTVELADRMVRAGLIRRKRNATDRREVLIRITPRGEALIERLSLAHRAELRSVLPTLAMTLHELRMKN